MLKLQHLTPSDHEEAARLLKQVQDDLTALISIVARAPFTDAVLRVQKRVQETLIDPLRDAHFEGRCEPAHTPPGTLYPSVGYGIRK
jgi:hypothetical protein